MSVTTVPIQPIKKGSMIKLWLGIIVVVLVAAGLAFIGTQEAVATGATNEQFLANNADEEGVITTDSGLQYKVLKPGEGPSPIATDTALVKYEGSLRDGTVFDANEQTLCRLALWFPVFPKRFSLCKKAANTASGFLLNSAMANNRLAPPCQPIPS